MEIVLFLLPFVLLGIAVLFIAFSGGPGAAREAYLTRGGTAFKILIPILYVGLGIAVPAAVIASREEGKGGTAKLRDEAPDTDTEQGKLLFKQTCASCHSLAAVNARGVTGPNLDEVGELSKKRVLGAIKVGGTGQKRMPAGLLTGQDAEDVATFVSQTAAK